MVTKMLSKDIIEIGVIQKVVVRGEVHAIGIDSSKLCPSMK